MVPDASIIAASDVGSNAVSQAGSQAPPSRLGQVTNLIIAIAIMLQAIAQIVQIIHH
jgi:hypothetical protein